MADSSIDVLMRVIAGGSPLEGEGQTEWSTAQDMLRNDFLLGKFCELREFNFSAGVASSMSDDEDEDDKAKNTAAAQPGAAPKPGEPPKPAPPAKAAPPTGGSKKKGKGGKDHDFVDMQPVEFTRLMDRMSPRLFQALTTCETLDSISVVKRKAAGTRNSGAAYLRLDFTKVLLTQLDWKDSEQLILESGTFIYRKLKIQYRPQRPDGALGTPISTEWTMPQFPKA